MGSAAVGVYRLWLPKSLDGAACSAFELCHVAPISSVRLVARNPDMYMSEGAVRCGARRIDAHVVLVGKDPISLATETGRAAVPGPEDGSEVTLEGTPRCYTGSDVHEHGWDYIVSVGYVGCGSSRTDLACGRGHVTENCCCCCCRSRSCGTVLCTMMVAVTNRQIDRS